MNPIAKIAEGLIGPVTDLLSEFITDKDKRDELAHKLATMTAAHTHEQVMGQIEIANTQAKHSSLFVAGARPAILWICAAALLFNTIIHPVIGIWVPELDPVDGDLLYPVMVGMLGLGAARSWEKSKGVARNSMTQ